MSDSSVSLVGEYLRAAAVLYGCMPLGTLYEIFCHHNGEVLSASDFCRMAMAAQTPDQPFRIVGDDDIYRRDISVKDTDRCVIHRQYCYGSWDALLALESAQEGKRPRLFTRERMLAYADPQYIPPTSQICDLLEVLDQFTTEEVPLLQILMQALALAADDRDGLTFLKEMQHLGCRFGSAKDRMMAMGCYQRVWDMVPKPIHNGHSEQELVKWYPLPIQDLWFCPPSRKDPFCLTLKQLMEQEPSRGITDYQRFLERCMAEPSLPPRLLEPCFCGSGLDYIDCCGKR